MSTEIKTPAELAAYAAAAERQAQHVLEASIGDARSPVDMFELPCGYLDEAKGEVHSLVQLRELTLEQEDLLSNQKIPLHQRIDSIFNYCVTRLGDLEKKAIPAALKKLPITDRDYLFFALRRRSLGDVMPLREQCPYCQTTHVYNVDLASLPVYKLADPLVREKRVVLPSGKVCTVRQLTGADEHRRDAMKKVLGSRSLVVYLRLKELDGKSPVDPDAVKVLSAADRDQILATAMELEGGLDTSVEITCKSCEMEFERSIDVTNPAFLYPSESQASWKKKSNFSS